MDLHLYFGKKDTDLIQWKNSLPKREISRLIQLFCEAEINGRKAVLPHIDYVSPEGKELKPYNTILHIKNVVIEQYFKMIPEYQRNAVLKTIIRKNIGSTDYAMFIPRETEMAVPKLKTASPKKKKQKPKPKPQQSDSSPVIKISYDPDYRKKQENEKEQPPENNGGGLKSALLRMAGD